MINNDNIDSEQKAACATSMLDIQKRIEKETAAEAMIKSKGFSQAYVRIDDATVDVVVDKQTLTDAEIAQIEDIVKRKTGFEADKIRINPLKPVSYTHLDVYKRQLLWCMDDTLSVHAFYKKNVVYRYFVKRVRHVKRQKV